MDLRVNQCNNTVFILFGASGDLSHRKIVPSLYSLFLDGLLPEKFIESVFYAQAKNQLFQKLLNG